jgi:hypothetical protein
MDTRQALADELGGSAQLSIRARRSAVRSLSSRSTTPEHLGFLHISLQQPHELGFSSAVKLHS